ncbi:hypothetical protein ICM05_01525 [Leucobacter sp. cx-42]|uniref:hypothetical protein n=1 Tax=unclassified Leucobacter TaxID=2621730 RepID=UPI00165E5803|nr:MULTISPECIES: hypothetical protein [unclassified Leucobacter]MBC9953326.1 hypothetical protein [Leucobacter sp. cx-42]
MIIRAVMHETPPLPAAASDEPVALDVYRLPETDLSEVTGIIIAGDADQVFLAEQQQLLDGFVERGGRVLVNGHVQRPFLTGLATWCKLAFAGPRDLRLTRLNDHPVWEGADPDLFLFSTGEPGPQSLERLREIGVAGFYGRGYPAWLPEHAMIIHGLGELLAPIDYEYPLGAGRVLVHCGNDLTHFISADRGTAHMGAQLTAWLRAADEQKETAA